MGGKHGTLVLLLVHALSVQIISYALRPAISYAILDLGFSSSWLGVATAAFALPPLVLALPSGRLADRMGERLCLVIGAVSFLTAAVLAVVAGDSLLGLLAATVLLGLGVLFSVVGEQAWVMRTAASGRLDSVFGLYTFVTSTGQMLGPLLLSLPPDEGAHAPPFSVIAGIIAAVAAVCLALSLLIPPVDPRSGRSQGGAGPRMLRGTARLLGLAGVLRALIASSLVLSSLDIVLAYLPLLSQERHFAASWITIMLVARGAATMVSRITLSRLTRRFGRRRVLVIGGLLSALSLLALALPLGPLGLTAAMALYGIAAGTVQPLTMSWITLATPASQRGLAASLRLVGNRAGQTAIPLVVAALSTLGGASVVFAFTGASLVCAAWASTSAPNDGGNGSANR